jgi:spore maturation protein CgeB
VKLSPPRLAAKHLTRILTPTRRLNTPRARIGSLLIEAGSPGRALRAPALGSNGHQTLILEPEAKRRSMEIVILGSTITHSGCNGHASTYGRLVRELSARGHRVLFLERDGEGYAWKGNLPKPRCARVGFYSTLEQLKDRYARAIKSADVIIVGSYVKQGIAIGEWVSHIAEGVTAFYDMDTPVTIANLAKGNLDYLSKALIPRYQIYLSFAGGPVLNLLENRYGSPMARPLYGCVDPDLYHPEECERNWDLGYLGTYSEERQPALDELLLEPARNWKQGRFVVAGSQYPRSIGWPKNVKRDPRLSMAKRRVFYNAQKFTLNITPANMVEAGYAPSVRLFEAAACGTPIISDDWEGLDTFFEPKREILITHSAEMSLYYLLETTEEERLQLAARARARVLANHTAKHRALELESYILDLKQSRIARSAA